MNEILIFLSFLLLLTGQEAFASASQVKSDPASVDSLMLMGLSDAPGDLVKKESYQEAMKKELNNKGQIIPRTGLFRK
jgi:hypothetical protein